jgi:hypothetical protein
MAPEPRRSGPRRWAEANLDLLATVLLAVAAVAAAWSSYQSARWGGVQTIEFSRANAARIESTRASAEASRQTTIDVLTFTQWANAYARGNEQLTDFYFDRFRDEFKPAVQAWIATRPLRTAGAPETPFVMPEYRLAKNAEAQRLVDDAERSVASARASNQRSDNYVLAVVLFAAALFFAGISTKLPAARGRLLVLGLGYVVFVGTFVWILTFPVTVSV